MRYQRDLQGALHDRYRRLVDASPMTIGDEIRLVARWIIGQPALRGILAEAERVESGLDFEAWEKCFSTQRVFRWNCETESGRTTLAWKLLCLISDESDADAREVILGYATWLSGMRVAVRPEYSCGWRSNRCSIS